jgi:DNA-binding transcriptional regulator YhcF (GntR family)
MQFTESQPIYSQIADLVCEKLLLGVWPAGERVPSIRELAVELGVNPNTVLRTYDLLQQEAIIVNRRGIGIFAADDCMEQATRFRKAQFVEKDLRQFYNNLYLLGMELDELKPGFDQFKKQMKRERGNKTTK